MSQTRLEKFKQIENSLNMCGLSVSEIFVNLANYYKGISHSRAEDYRLRVKPLIMYSIVEFKELPLKSIATLLNVKINRYFGYDIIVAMEETLNKNQDILCKVVNSESDLTDDIEDSVVFFTKLVDILSKYGY